ncbi:hypothetical protein EMIT0373P_10498 [Pseudomonas chlororaphis]
MRWVPLPWINNLRRKVGNLYRPGNFFNFVNELSVFAALVSLSHFSKELLNSCFPPGVPTVSPVTCRGSLSHSVILELRIAKDFQRASQHFIPLCIR